MSAFNVGDRVLITNATDAKLNGLECVVVRGLKKYPNEPGPALYTVRSIEDRRMFYVPHSGLAGPLIEGGPAVPGTWDTCIWKPQEISR